MVGKPVAVNFHPLETPKTSHSCLRKKVLSKVFPVVGKDMFLVFDSYF